MGAGHRYNITNFMLFDRNDFAETEKLDALLKNFNTLPFAQQAEAIIDSGLFPGIVNRNDVFMRFDQTPVESNNPDGFEMKLLDSTVSEQFNNVELGESIEFGMLDLKEQITEIAASLNTGFVSEHQHIDDMISLSAAQVPTVGGDYTIHVGLISDQYNDGAATWLEVGGEQIYNPSLSDAKNAVLADYSAYIEHDFLTTKPETPEDCIDYIETIAQILPEDVINTLFKDEQSTAYLLDVVDRVDEGQEVDWNSALAKVAQYVTHCESVLVHGAQNILDTFQSTSEQLMDKLIDSQPNHFFRYPTSAYTSCSYDKQTQRFSGPVSNDKEAALTL